MERKSPTKKSGKKHPYHLVDPSPWPLVAAAAVLLTGVGAPLAMHGHGSYVFILGLTLLLYTMYVWWRDVVREGTYQKHHTPEVRTGLRIGMVLFIASEVMFFVAFFWAFFNASLMPPAEIGSVWPPKDIEVIPAFDLPYFNTLLLLLSGTTVTWAHHALEEGDQKSMLQGLGLTILLGILFLCVQAYEYGHASFAFKGGIYPTTFYMATGFHGAHVLIGTIFLIVCFFRGLKGHFKPNHHVGFEAAAWYWHFVDVVWLFLFIWIYWWGNN